MKKIPAGGPETPPPPPLWEGSKSWENFQNFQNFKNSENFENFRGQKIPKIFNVNLLEKKERNNLPLGVFSGLWPVKSTIFRH